MTRRSKELKKTATWMSRSDGVPAAPRFVRASLGGLTRRWGSCGSGGSRFLRGPGAAALWTTRGGPDGNKRLSAAGCTWGGGLARVGRRGGRHPRPRAWCRGQGRRGHLRTRRREVVDGYVTAHYSGPVTQSIAPNFGSSVALDEVPTTT